MVLNRRQSVAAGLAALAVTAAFIGCSLFRGGRRTADFRHAPHTRQGIACAACHEGVVEDEGRAMPDWRTCQACHGGVGDRRPEDWEEPILAYDPDARVPGPELPRDLVFSHEVHAGAGLDCAACHDEGDPELPAAAACVRCHEDRSVAADCAACHRGLRRDRPPPSHAVSTWMRTHGAASEAPVARGHDQGCRLCHSESDCDGCHRDRRPADHTEFFRRRGHGLVSEIDRDRCATCHLETFCERCHQQVRPPSHVASWGGATSRHCLRCHVGSVSSSGCFACHRDTPSHRLATPVPAPPHPSVRSDCRRCHLRPPHTDNGSDCTLCHR